MTEFGEIPSDWDFKSLKDICYIKGRIGWQGLRKDEFISEGPYLITGINFDRGRIIWNECYHITNERYEQAPEIQLKVGDVLMTKDGTIGKLLYVDNLPDKASLNSHLFVMRPINDSFISKYFYYHLQSEKFKKYIDNNKTGSTMPAITQAAMEKYKLILPTLEEQEKIASILSTVDEQIDNVDVLIKKNKDLKKGLMQTLLTKGIGHTKFKKTEIGEIPEEWTLVKIGDVAKFQAGYAFKSSDYVDNGVKLVKITNVQQKDLLWNDTDFLPEEFLNKYKEYSLEINDVIIAMTRPIISSGIKICKVKKEDTPALLNQRVGRFITSENVNNKYLYQYCFSNYFINKVNELCSTTGQPNISSNQLESIMISLPSTEEQEKIGSILLNVDEKMEEYENKKQRLEELKKGLMQQLLTGNIRII